MTTDSAVDEHIGELLASLSLERKVRLLTGEGFWSTRPEPAIGLRRMVLSDGPSGVRGETWDERDPSLNLPSATALAASWDPSLAYRYGAALAAEARRKGVDVLLGPTINLHRSPRGGRHFEAFSEDSLLTGELADRYVRGLQDHGVAATPKHYVANDSETDRFTADVVVGERALRELYLAPFEQAVTRAGAWLVMSAYNAVAGTTMTENDLLDAPLCGEWGFDGVVISDWTAVRSTVPSARARQDLVMPGPHGPWGDALVAAVRDGRVSEGAVEEKVRRLLRLAVRVGALDGGTPSAAVVPPPAEQGPALAREVCGAGMVLVRNTGELPWAGPGPRSIALIGEHARSPRTQGGGSATVLPEYIASPLDGLRAALPGTRITWSRGVAVRKGITPLDVAALHDPLSGEPGVRARFLADDGRELLTENRRATNLVWLGTTPAGAATLELRTRYRAADTGTVRLGVACVGRVRLLADDQTVVDTELAADGADLGAALLYPPAASAPVRTDAGSELDLTVRCELTEIARAGGATAVTFGTQEVAGPVDAGIAAAADAAHDAEVAVVVVGTSEQVESEGFDRSGLALPGAQDELVRAVAAANPRTVVVVNAGSPVTMPWRDDVPAILLGWFGGQEFGHALADVLIGTTEPGGRLPTTWPADEADVPVLSTTPVDGRMRYDEGIHIGYRAWLRSGAEPAYPFGHGLGYTEWELSGLHVGEATPGEAVDATITVRNTGERAGKYVVQAYLSRADSAVDRPDRWLAGFATVHLDAGAEQAVRIILPARTFAHWDAGFRTEPGTFTLHVGPDATHTPHTVPLTLE